MTSPLSSVTLNTLCKGSERSNGPRSEAKGIKRSDPFFIHAFFISALICAGFFSVCSTTQ